MVGLVARVLALAVLSVASIGCASIPSFPVPPHDSGVQCSASVPCPTGQMCLQGLCFAQCDSTHTCGPREQCSMGICVTRTNDAGPIPHDAGVDGGRCAVLTCMAPTPVCAFERCLQCQSSASDCPSTTPICDIGRGSCVTPAPAYCAPCNNTFDCAGTPTPSTCVNRTAPDAIEHVCLPTPVGGACPAGFMNAGANCVPIYFSCTALRAAQQHRPCTADTDCPQLGATASTGVFTGMCGLDSTGTMHICHYTCGIPTDCPAGLTCNAAMGFCQ
jgi:hypothetical protein